MRVLHPRPAHVGAGAARDDRRTRPRAEIEEGLAGNLCRCARLRADLRGGARGRRRRGDSRGRARDAAGRRSTSRRAGRRPWRRSERSASLPRRVGGTGARHRASRLRRRHARPTTRSTSSSSRSPSRGRGSARSTRRRRWRVPGVRLVMTAADLPQPMPRFGPQRHDRPVLATGETKYHGEPVAAVAAETQDAAEEAAALVTVDYEELPARLHDRGGARRRTRRSSRTRRSARTIRSRQTNVLREHRHRLGRRRRGGRGRRPRRRGHVRLPDGHPVRDRAARVHGRARRRRHRGLERDPAPVLAAARHRRRCSGCRSPKVRVYAPDPGGAFGGKQHAKYEPLLAFMALATGRPVRLVLTPRGDVPGGPPGSDARSTSAPAFTARRHVRLPGHRRELPDRRLRRHRRPGRGQGLYTGERAVQLPGRRGSSPAASCRTPCRRPPSAASATRRSIWAVESNIDEAARAARHRPARAPAAEPRAAAATRSSPFDTPADGDWAEAVRRAAELIGWGTPPTPTVAAAASPSGIKSGPTTGLSLLDRPAAGRRQRRRLRRHVRHGPGRADDLRPDRAPTSSARRSTGSRSSWATRPSCRTTSRRRPSRSTVLMGNAVLAACRDIQAQAAAMAARLEASTRRRHRRRGEVRIGDRELPIRDVLRRGLGRLGGEIIGVGESRKEAEPDHPLGGSAAFYEFNCTAVEVSRRRGDRRHHDPPPRDRVGRRQGAQPAPGPDAGRGRRDHGPRPHADGALHLRRRRAGSGTSARSTTGSRPRWTCRAGMESDIDRERRRARAVRREGHERGRAAAGRAGGRRGRRATRPAS